MFYRLKKNRIPYKVFVLGLRAVRQLEVGVRGRYGEGNCIRALVMRRQKILAQHLPELLVGSVFYLWVL